MYTPVCVAQAGQELWPSYYSSSGSPGLYPHSWPACLLYIHIDLYRSVHDFC